MKREIKHHYLESREFLQELTIKTYKESIYETKVHDKWARNIYNKSLVTNYESVKILLPVKLY